MAIIFNIHAFLNPRHRISPLWQGGGGAADTLKLKRLEYLTTLTFQGRLVAHGFWHANQ